MADFLLSKSAASSGEVASSLSPLLIGVLLAAVSSLGFTPALTLAAYILVSVDVRYL